MFSCPRFKTATNYDAYLVLGSKIIVNAKICVWTWRIWKQPNRCLNQMHLETKTSMFKPDTFGNTTHRLVGPFWKHLAQCTAARTKNRPILNLRMSFCAPEAGCRRSQCGHAEMLHHNTPPPQRAPNVIMWNIWNTSNDLSCKIESHWESSLSKFGRGRVWCNQTGFLIRGAKSHVHDNDIMTSNTWHENDNHMFE